MKNKQTNNKQKQPKTQIITDTASMAFDANHRMWWVVDEYDHVVDFFSYDEFFSYIGKMVQLKLDDGYSVITIEGEFQIEVNAVKGKSKNCIATFFMCNDKED